MTNTLLFTELAAGVTSDDGLVWTFPSKCVSWILAIESQVLGRRAI